jgi:hypothetical protein
MIQNLKQLRNKTQSKSIGKKHKSFVAKDGIGEKCVFSREEKGILTPAQQAMH